MEQMNMRERITLVKAMEYLARQVNSEDVFMAWLEDGVADGDIRYGDTEYSAEQDNEDLEYYIEDDTLAVLMDDFLRLMRDALKDGEDFDTGWWGCSKEIRYARIVREHGGIRVSVSCHMDDLYEADDLIYDALWAARHTEEELPEDIIENIRDVATDDGIDDCTELSESLPADADLEQIVEAIGRMENEAEQNNTKMFTTLEATVGATYDWWKNGGLNDIKGVSE